jgi:hypothetical protein
MMRTAFNLPLRQIEGLMTSVINLIGIIGNFITRGLTVVWSGREIVGCQTARNAENFSTSHWLRVCFKVRARLMSEAAACVLSAIRCRRGHTWRA